MLNLTKEFFVFLSIIFLFTEPVFSDAVKTAKVKSHVAKPASVKSKAATVKPMVAKPAPVKSVDVKKVGPKHKTSRKNKKTHHAKQPPKTTEIESAVTEATDEHIAVKSDENISGGGVYITPKVIRVLIDSYSSNNDVTLTVKAKNGFVLESPGGSKVTAIFDNKNVEVIAKKGKLYLRCSDQKFRHIRYDDLEVYASSGYLELNGKKYQGSVNLRIDPLTGNVLMINRIDLDDYVCSVLRSESVPSWPLEMQKVQAIASRSYALYHMKQVRLKNPRSFYDIRCTKLNQVYDGVHEFKHLRDAVDQTHGLILTYKGDIAEAMFDICCGGVVPANMRRNRRCMPYLRRSKPCNFCKNTAFYRTQLVYKKDNFLNIVKASPALKKRFEGFGNKLHDIQVTDRDSAGVVHKVRLAGRKYVNITGAELLSLFGDKIKSLAFTIKKDDNKLIFAMKGWGHFNGLCQWGARSLVSQGWDYRKILNFYYPGTSLSKLK